MIHVLTFGNGIHAAVEYTYGGGVGDDHCEHRCDSGYGERRTQRDFFIHPKYPFRDGTINNE